MADCDAFGFIRIWRCVGTHGEGTETDTVQIRRKFSLDLLCVDLESAWGSDRASAFKSTQNVFKFHDDVQHG